MELLLGIVHLFVHGTYFSFRFSITLDPSQHDVRLAQRNMRHVDPLLL